jgi:F-type H+-transporting ATPase subunit epsilon
MDFEIVTPKGSKVKTTASYVSAPGTVGELGILPGHRPLITSLGIGVLSYSHEGRTDYLAVNGGYLEVADDQLVVITETAEVPEEIDVPRAEAALKRAEERIRDLEVREGEGLKFAHYARERATTRLEASKLKTTKA